MDFIKHKDTTHASPMKSEEVVGQRRSLNDFCVHLSEEHGGAGEGGSAETLLPANLQVEFPVDATRSSPAATSRRG